MRYSQYCNEKIGQRGHLWQGRFYSCPLDGVHLYMAMRYVERNPVRARIVEKAEDYTWSSAASHVRGIDNPILSIAAIDDWDKYLDITEEEEEEGKWGQHPIFSSKNRVLSPFSRITFIISAILIDYSSLFLRLRISGHTC
ncbi:hypothetical protein COZ71_09210 [Candidatus Desantisbacteria bacterium CG_4_8_14_3_um_filter_40_12]|uniref:Transposase IS200-like domain-containing protein n=1 Tax=Candidatus Desantisbacteria bacterium CG_4_8_14_3_um_filter_40_12 TaxID=1974545 RepID=A0A2M7J912_9BACT|nr:MAG: hypothetical protein COZ71_09210 [Candidatus Desantisbacteria bacterium CG_4_8_14_3_um_filter_40_12]